jgi:hypothetical protein
MISGGWWRCNSAWIRAAAPAGSPDFPQKYRYGPYISKQYLDIT